MGGIVGGILVYGQLQKTDLRSNNLVSRYGKVDRKC